MTVEKGDFGTPGNCDYFLIFYSFLFYSDFRLEVGIIGRCGSSSNDLMR